jgi:hypothetical protein
LGSHSSNQVRDHCRLVRDDVLSAYLLAPAAARVPVLVWGLASWSYFHAQQARLIGVAGVELASVGF